MALEIGKTVDGYEIVEVLGSSKTGVAYKVRNIFAQRFEVLKILPKSVQDDEEQNARFLREIKVHAQLLHPNIVTFYNAREMAGQLVMTTEFVPGVTLAERLEAGPIAWRDACQYSNQALLALGYAHAHGIVHRGVSTSNLILTPEGNIRLTGFSLAKSAADPELTAAGSVIGALKYMAPEQVKGETIDGRSDLYSLGIVLYEMLTGKLPFAAKGQFEIMLAHVNTAPKHASDVNDEVPRELGDAVAKVLAKSPDDRFPDAQQFRGAIEQISLKSERKPEAPAPAPAFQPAPARFESDSPTPVSSSEPWDAWSFDSPLVAGESNLTPATPKAFESETLSTPTPAVEPAPEPVVSTPVVEFAGISETPAPITPSVLWDAHAIEAALLSAQSKLTAAEPKPAVDEPVPVQPVSQASALTETPAPAPASRLWEAWSYDPKPAQVESPAPAALETVEPLAENAVSIEPDTPVSSSFLWDAWSINPNPAPVESIPEPAVLQQEEPAVEAAAHTETQVPVSSSTLWDGWAVEPPLKSAEPTVAEAKASLVEAEPAEAEIAAHTETPLPVSSSTLWDGWAVEPPLKSSELETATPHEPWAIEGKASPVESDPAEAEIAAHIETPVPVASSNPWDAWATEAKSTPQESTPNEPWAMEAQSSPVESGPAQAQIAAPLPAVTAAAEDQAAPSLFGDWMSNWTPAQPETQPESSEFKPLSAVLEPPPAHAEPSAETPVPDWPARLPDSWANGPAHLADSQHESSELKLLSAALEPESAVEQTPPPALPSTLEESWAIESKPPALELAAPSPEPEPAPALAAAAAVASAPEPVVQAVRAPNTDLWTALFGDTLLARLSLALVVCAITFFLGTVTLFAVLSVTKP